MIWSKVILSFYVSSSNQVNIPLVVPSAPKDSAPPPTFHVYSRRQTSHCSSDDSLLVPTPPSPPALTIEHDLPIFIRKGIRSTRNPYP